MKKIFFSFALCSLLTSCYINTHVVGTGSKGTSAVRSKTLYVFGNRVLEADSKAMAEGADNYTIDTRENLLDMLVNCITFHIVGLRTVTVEK